MSHDLSEDEVLDDVPLAIEEHDRFELVPGYPGVMTCPALRAHRLGFAGPNNILCCLACPWVRLLNLNTCATHVKTHLTGISSTTRVPGARIVELCRRLNVYSGLLSDILPPPDEPSPLIFLPIHQVWSCILCTDIGITTLSSSSTARKDHYKDHHKNSHIPREASDHRVAAQTYCETYSAKQYFRVYPEKAVARAQDLEDTFSVRPAAVADMVSAYAKEWTPAERVPVDLESLKQVQPFIYYMGWARHIENKDVDLLRSLVETPEKDDPLRYLMNAAIEVFKTDQLTLHDVHLIHRENLMNDESGPEPPKAFQPLQPQTALEYSRAWGLWAVFVCRLFKMKDDPRYPCVMTKAQQKAVECALEYCDATPTRRSATYTILNLSRQFWCPKSCQDFDHIAADQFNDPTVRFACLINLQKDGTFSSPRNAAHQLVRIKYFIRAALFMWSRREQALGKKTQDFVISAIAWALSRRRLSPFACLCIAVSHATTYAYTTSNLPNVIWSGIDSLKLEGQDIRWSEYRKAFAEEIIDLEAFIYEDVLLGLTDSNLGFDITETTELFDDLASRAEGYSVFRDPRNPFKAMQHNLANCFFAHPAASHLHKGLDSKGNIVWDEQGTGEWLYVCERATKRLLFVMHGVGGQPGRGVEVCLMKAHNPQWRLRNIYFIAPGRLIFVLYYGKTSGGTGLDRPIAHAVPWRVGRLFLIMHAIVNPLVGVLTARVTGVIARAIQEQSAFAAFGRATTADQLAAEIQAWFLRHLKVPIKLRLFRQLIMAFQKHLMPEAFSAVRKALNIVDAQAGHSSETAEQHYALDASEANFLSVNTVLKYVLASGRWWLVLLEGFGILTETERCYGNDAPLKLAMAEDYPCVGRTISPFQTSDLKQLADFLVEDGRFTTGIVENLIGHIGTMTIEKPTRSRHTDANDTSTAIISPCRTFQPVLNLAPTPMFLPDPAASAQQLEFASKLFNAPLPALIVEPRHLVHLRRFLKNEEATWTSASQAQALVHILSRQQSLLCVLPTGGGKSVLFASLPYYETGLTVVVFTLRALLVDQCLASRRRDPKRPFQVWTPGLIARDCVVVVMIERVATPEFLDWCFTQNSRHTLNRIVLDECHMIVTESDYRVVMRNLKAIVQADVPLVCLSATVPPVMEVALSLSIGSPSWRIMREGTQRPNLHLRAVEYTNRTVALSALKVHVEHLQQFLKPGEGVLILCRTYEDVDDVAAMLSCPFYHSKMGTDEKDAAADDWLAGKSSIIVSTSALGTGINHPACRFLIYLGLPSGSIDYGQGIGRIGRDGKAALATILFWRPYPIAKYVDLKGYVLLLEMLDGQECMRLYMSRYLDGETHTVTCSSTGFAECGRCFKAMKLAWLRTGTALAGPDIGSMQRQIHASPDLIDDLPAFCRSALLPALLGPQDTDTASAHDLDTPPAEPPEGPGEAPLRHGRPQLVDQSTLDVAGDLAGLPSPVGDAIHADANASRQRAANASEMERREETRHYPMNIPTLLAVKTLSENLCISCLVAQRMPMGHLFYHCPYLTTGQKHFSLSAYPIQNCQFAALKTKMRRDRPLPTDNTICVFCFWPKNELHGHARGKPPTCCSCQDMILPACWLILHNPTLQQSMKLYFSLAAVNTPADYFAWLTQTSREMSWLGEDTRLINAQRIYIWLVLVQCKQRIPQ